MNQFSIARMLKGLAAANLLALAAANAAWADDHLFSINSATVITPGIVTHAGAVTQALTINFSDPPPPGNTTTVTLGTSQTLTVVSALVKMCKPGTNNQLEWLDQGNTVVGVTGTLTNGTTSTVPTNGYRLTLTMTGISNTYATSSGSCSVSGQKTFTYTAGALLEQRVGNSANFTTKLTTTYNFWNTTNTAPEPGTVVLMLTGLLFLGWMSMKRMRPVRDAST